MSVAFARAPRDGDAAVAQVEGDRDGPGIDRLRLLGLELAVQRREVALARALAEV